MKFEAYDLTTGEHIANVSSASFDGARVLMEKTLEQNSLKIPFVLVPVESAEES